MQGQETRVTYERPFETVVHAVVTVTVAGTAVQVPVTSRCREVRFFAPSGNAGAIFIGTSGVTNAGTPATQGWALTAGQSFGPVALANPNQLWINAAVNGDRAVILAFQ